jgi:hypothetical protein
MKCKESRYKNVAYRRKEKEKKMEGKCNNPRKKTKEK